MARVIGTPGESAGVRGLVLLVAALLAGVFLGAYSIWALAHTAQTLGAVGLLASVVWLGALVGWRRRDVAEIVDTARQGGHFLRGAQGELLVGQALAGLPDDFIVFNDFHPTDLVTGDSAKWNVDHIVVGPTGVFVIDAKNYGTTVVPPASQNNYYRKNVNQVQRNALELKDRLVRASAGELAELFVVPIVVYTQPNARIMNRREGSVRVLSVNGLNREITRHAETAINMDRAGRIAMLLFAQVSTDLQAKFSAEMSAYGELSKAARYAARDAFLASSSNGAPAQTAKVNVPDVCPLCGGKLRRRTARHGTRSGKQFMGCENYRSTGCRYGFNLDD